MTEGSSLI